MSEREAKNIFGHLHPTNNTHTHHETRTCTNMHPGKHERDTQRAERTRKETVVCCLRSFISPDWIRACSSEQRSECWCFRSCARSQPAGQETKGQTGEKSNKEKAQSKQSTHRILLAHFIDAAAQVAHQGIVLLLLIPNALRAAPAKEGHASGVLSDRPSQRSVSRPCRQVCKRGNIPSLPAGSLAPSH